MSDRPPLLARPSRLTRPARLSLLLTSFAVVVGCGDGKIKCYPVSGAVQVGGKPYEGARVFLFPVGGSDAFQKERPFAITDASGRFELTTFVRGDGAPAGDYTVIVRNNTPSNAEEAKRWAKRPKIAKEYGRPADSPLKATIPPEPTELDPFDLKPATKR